jgi:hypothetical protein
VKAALPFPWRAGGRKVPAMGRTVTACIAGCAFLILWVGAATILADHVSGLNFAVQFLYFAVAGFVWVFPVRWLMLWAAHQRA